MRQEPRARDHRQRLRATEGKEIDSSSEPQKEPALLAH